MASPSPLTRAVAQVVEQDAELAETARALAFKALSLANQYLDSGSPKMRLEVIKSLMPAIGRAMSDKGESDEIKELREQVQQMMRSLSGESDVA